MTVFQIDVARGPREFRRFLKRQASRRRRRLWRQLGSYAPTRVTRGWWS